MNADDFVRLHMSAPERIYRQLVDQVRRRVAAGQLLARREIFSARELEQELAVNPMTGSKASSLLGSEGVLEHRRGLPMVVAQQHQQAQPTASRVELLRPALEQASASARQLEFAQD